MTYQRYFLKYIYCFLSVPDYPASLPTALAFGGANLGGAPAPMGGVYVNQAAFSRGRGLSVKMEGDSLFKSKKSQFPYII